MKNLLKVLVLVGVCFTLPSCEVVAVAAALSSLATQPYDSQYNRPYNPQPYRYANPHNPYNSVITPDPWDSYEDESYEPDDCPAY